MLFYLIFIYFNLFFIFFPKGCDVRVIEKPPGGHFTYEEIKQVRYFKIYTLKQIIFLLKDI